MSSVEQKCVDDNIPLADDDPQVVIGEDDGRLTHGQSTDSLRSSYTGSSSPGVLGPRSLEPDAIDEQEEKARLISQVLELQNTLDGRYLLHIVLTLGHGQNSINND